MNSELTLIWNELQADFASPVFVWQLAVIALSLVLAWSINGVLRAYVMRNAPEHWKLAIGGINRLLLPLTTLVLVWIGQLVLSEFQHVAMLKLFSRLLIAMAVIRLTVYALRYIFNPSGWLRAMENTISAVVWGVFALHLTGILPDIYLALESVSFSVGKNKLNLLILFQGLATILITLFIALWFSRILENRLMGAENVSMNTRVVLAKLVRVFLSFVAVLIALSAVGLDITLLSVFGGALGVGLAFGLQKIASNYVSGFIILVDHSIQIGDLITVDIHYGVVKDLRSRYLTLRKLDGTEVIIPNEMLITEIVINHTSADHRARIQMPIQVAYSTDLNHVINLLKEITNGHERILKTQPVDVFIKGFGESGIDLILSFWISDPEEGSAKLQTELFLSIWQAFKAQNIEIPFPQRELHILQAN
jgi:small-conductance mechanosensitive channel